MKVLIALLVVLTISSLDAKKKGKPSSSSCAKPNAKQLAVLKKYTAKKTGCACWFDLTMKKDCACCKTGGQQCGYPMQGYCQSIKAKSGCPGIPQNKYTLSTKGYPCFSDHSRLDCAWCKKGFSQCGTNKNYGPDSKCGNVCTKAKNVRMCDNQIGDCKHIPRCDYRAKCLNSKKNGFQCKCNGDLIGNGQQCIDSNGNLSVNPADNVEIDIEVDHVFDVMVGDGPM